MFQKILIANRGEIACRVAATARRMGIVTVGIYSEADAGALHLDLCDEAYLIGPAPAAESYLRGEVIIDVAQRSGAQAIHPGYGFLSENAEFAEACEAAGLQFIGPPSSAIRTMGSKSLAKALMQQAGVPLVPGYHEQDQELETLRSAAEEIGYPLLIKASAGGGGKGMRVVENPDQFEPALAAARREAGSAFGDERMLLERYLQAPRHVELQVFADGQGNTLHLFERDCSIQRRHQKVLEEAPAPGLDQALRERMGEAAVAAARAIDYRGAGTVEFLLEGSGAFYFMEMNTRLQVEHPVTEMITGLDLVEWQLRVASGESLPLVQSDLRISGHAIEARIYAENPDQGFLPATGELRYLRTPSEGPHVRIDSGVRQGDSVSVHYDPMIAKLIVWDRDRGGALRRLRSALTDYRIVGVSNNLQFLSRLCANPDYLIGRVDTGFIENHRAELITEDEGIPEDAVVVVCLHELLSAEKQAKVLQAVSHDPYSPWGVSDGWRMNQDNHHRIELVAEGWRMEVIAHYRNQGFLLELPGGDRMVSGELDDEGQLRLELEGRRLTATVIPRGGERTVLLPGGAWCLTLSDPRVAATEGEDEENGLVAPMPGTVLAVLRHEGDRVAVGEPLMVVEAMKMEHSVLAPRTGSIKRICFDQGQQVEEGDQLLILE